MPTPYSTHVYDEVTSTQDVARALAGSGPALVVAARQTAGRGRSGSTWETAPRAVAVSLRSTPTGWPPERQTLLPLAAGVAVARLLGLELKWPNDLLLARRKVGGILVEATGAELVIGAGLNLWWPEAPADRSALWEDDPGPQAHVAAGMEIGAAIWAEVERGAERWDFEEYQARCSTLGRSITWGDDERGFVLGVDRRDGSLVVEQAGRNVHLRSGEVRYVRVSEAPDRT